SWTQNFQQVPTSAWRSNERQFSEKEKAPGFPGAFPNHETEMKLLATATGQHPQPHQPGQNGAARLRNGCNDHVVDRHSLSSPTRAATKTKKVTVISGKGNGAILEHRRTTDCQTHSIRRIPR